MLVSAERGAPALADLLADDDDVAIAAVTAAELLVGVALADERRRADREALVEGLIGSVRIESYDLDVARRHAVLLAHTGMTGRRRGAHDLLIAATALARNRIVVTRDARGFSDLPGVEVRRTALS